jgi:hypothetical protein
MSTLSLGSEVPGGGHVPTDPSAREVISRQLEPGENLLWAGRPNFLGVSIYAIALGLTWMLSLLIGTHKQVVLCSVVMLPLGAISLFVQAGIFYGVSDRRVLWFLTRSLGKKRLLGFPLCDALGAPLKIYRRPFGTLDFGGSFADEILGRRESFVFFLGSRAPAVYQIAAAAQRKLVDEAEQSVIAGWTSKPNAHPTRP